MKGLRRGYALIGAWLLLFVCRVAFGLSDPLTRWALRALTVMLVLAACIVVVRFVAEIVSAGRRGERVMTAPTVRGLLLGALVAGLVLRLVGWDSGEEGLVAWIGGVLVIIAICGLIALQFLRERTRWGRRSFYFDPYWKYGLLLVCLAALTSQALTEAEGGLSTFYAALFWVALIMFLVQGVGRWILRRRGNGAGTPAGAGR